MKVVNYMKKSKTLSFHPKLAAILDIFFGLLMIGWIRHIENVQFLAIWFVVRIVWWAVLVRMVYYSPGLRRFNHVLSLVIFHIGILLWLLFIEWSFSWYVVAAMSIVFPAISFWLLPVVKTELSFVGKPHRRFRLLLCMIGLAGIWGGVGALNTFNLFSVSIPVWVVGGSILSVVVGIFWWKEYGIKYSRLFWGWVLATTILLMEFSGVIILLPSGFLVNGFMIVWLWYVVWLLGRFHLSSEGINWKKQRWFLGIQLICLSLFLLLSVKWK
jgi:hypothetical protein